MHGNPDNYIRFKHGGVQYNGKKSQSSDNYYGISKRGLEDARRKPLEPGITQIENTEAINLSSDSRSLIPFQG